MILCFSHFSISDIGIHLLIDGKRNPAAAIKITCETVVIPLVYMIWIIVLLDFFFEVKIIIFLKRW